MDLSQNILVCWDQPPWESDWDHRCDSVVKHLSLQPLSGPLGFIPSTIKQNLPQTKTKHMFNYHFTILKHITLLDVSSRDETHRIIVCHNWEPSRMIRKAALIETLYSITPTTWDIKEEEVERIKETENDQGGSITKHCLLDMTWLGCS